MPELPEVETTRRGIEPHILNQKISQVIIRAPKLRWPIPKSIAKELPGQKVISIERRAKYLLIKFKTGTLIMHLGMSGRLQTLTAQTTPQKHDHVDILFSNGNCLRYTDPRRFGSILWTTDAPLQHELLAELGPEPFDAAFTGKYLLEKAHKKSIAVKKFIMDAKIVVGVGNIYASEALFAAALHPTRSVKTITLAEWLTLVQHIQRILKQAIKKGGTTLKDFLDTSGKPGYFSQKLQAYGRDGESCVRCDSGVIESLVIGQRNTFFCSNCQL
jgi:formamidopyrimidine-DNA glycosylase